MADIRESSVASMPVLLPRGLLDDVDVAARNDATKARYRRADAIETDWVMTYWVKGSSGLPIDSVHWSDDEGSSWQVAELTGPDEPYGWVRFQFRWRAAAGHYTLMTRATDRHRRTQPASVPFNDGGYLYNAIHPHPVTVE